MCKDNDKDKESAGGEVIELLPGGNQPNITVQALRDLKANLSAYTEYVILIAGLQKTKYDALRKEGFNDIQAIELSRSVFG